MTENGYNEEEMKMVKETHKIWGQEEVNITATCIRVPIMRAHAESINLEFSRDISEDEVSSLISSRPDRANCPLGCSDADARVPLAPSKHFIPPRENSFTLKGATSRGK